MQRIENKSFLDFSDSESNISCERKNTLASQHAFSYLHLRKLNSHEIKIHHRPFFLNFSLFETNNW
jgi:hypothetical protein